MKDAFIFETEAENPYSQQGEYEDFEGDFESDFESDYESDYEHDLEGEYESDYEGDYEGDFEGDFEGEYEGDFEGEDFEYADEIRGRARIPLVRGRAMPFRPVRRVGSFRPFNRVPYRFRPGANRFRNPYRWRPGMRFRPGLGYYRRGLGRYRPGPFGFPPPPQPGMGSDQFGMGGGQPADPVGSGPLPSTLVMLLQRLLNRTIGANLPVDGVMSVETRSALRSFQNQPSEPVGATPPTPPAPPPGGGPDAGAPPQAEYDELAFLESEFDEYGY